MIKKSWKIIAGIIGIGLLLAGIFYIVSWYGFKKERSDVQFGVTFSTVMARQLGLDTKKTFDAMVDDLGAQKIRLPVYWNEIEPEPGKYNFADYDYFIKKSEKADVKLVLVVGRKLPRWPECFLPDWAKNLPKEEFQKAVEKQIQEVVLRYRSSPALAMWQIENEPFHQFGVGCAGSRIKKESIDREISLVRSLDQRPILLTDSGEQGLWFPALRRADVLGFTTYFQVWNDELGVVRFPFGPGFYTMKGNLFSLFFANKKIIGSELQAEPWGPGKLLPDYDIKIQKELMNAEQFRKNISFARRTGFDTFYLWGAEWWYWLKEKQNDPSLWKEAKLLLKK